MKKLLLNYLVGAFVGHLVEVMRHARGLAEANPDVEIHVALSAGGRPEALAEIPWIAGVYTIDLGDLDGPQAGPWALDNLPKEWDYIIDRLDWDLNYGDRAPDRLDFEARALRQYYRHSSEVLTARYGRGQLDPDMRLPDGLSYKPGIHVTLPVPADARAFAQRYEHTGPKICVLAAGSSFPAWYPEVSSWIKILNAVQEAVPAARFYLTGIRRSEHGSSRTRSYNDHDIQTLLTCGPDMVDSYDIGFWNQVALLESCDMLISPRTGFAALSVCVGTPWLTIAGGDWAEYVFNGVPFYIVLPDDAQYPYHAGVYPQRTDTKIPHMRPEKLDLKIPEIVEGARLLLDPEFTYDAAVNRYRENIDKANVRREGIYLPGDAILSDF
jgi:hypothetical protein